MWVIRDKDMWVGEDIWVAVLSRGEDYSDDAGDEGRGVGLGGSLVMKKRNVERAVAVVWVEVWVTYCCCGVSDFLLCIPIW